MTRARASIALTLVLLVSVSASAADVRMRLGTIVPRDSSYHKILLRMGAAWQEQGVQLKIHPGGELGGEAQMVRLMKTGSLDGCLLTVVGLSEIDGSVRALQLMPFVFNSLDDVDYVTARLRPRLEKKLREKGFVMLFWGDAGWIRFFSKNPVITPDDLRKTKLFSWAGDSDTVDLYRSVGVHSIALETSDILTGLQTGLINAVPMPPYFALATQVYPLAPHMLEINWAPLVGGLAITERAWNRLTPPQQKALAEAAASAGRDIKARNRLEADQAVVAMQKRGLQVHRLTPQLEAQWRKETEAMYPQIRGRLVPPDLFDEVRQLVKERNGK